MKKIIINAILLLFVAISSGQEAFFRVYDSNIYGHTVSDIVITKDNSYVFLSTIELYGQKGMGLIYTDKNGEPYLKKEFFGIKEYQSRSLIKTKDNNLLIGGAAWSTQDETDAILIKSDLRGNILWKNSIGGFEVNNPRRFILTEDAEIFVIGWRDFEFKKTFIAKFDAGGMNLWCKELDHDPRHFFATDLAKTRNGELILCGGAYPVGKLIKTTGDGTYLSSQIYPTFPRGNFSNLVKCNDSCYVSAVSFENLIDTTYRSALIKFDDNYNIIWRCDLHKKNHYSAIEVCATSDSSFVILGNCASERSNEIMMYITKVDHEGKLLWTKYYDGFYHIATMMIKETPDKGFIITGSISFRPNGSQPFLMKTDSEGNCNMYPVSIDEKRTSVPLDIYPNPASNWIMIKSGLSMPVSYKISDLHGKLVSSAKLKQEPFRLSVAKLPDGMYFMTITTDKGIKVSKKFIKR